MKNPCASQEALFPSAPHMFGVPRGCGMLQTTYHKVFTKFQNERPHSNRYFMEPKRFPMSRTITHMMLPEPSNERVPVTAGAIVRATNSAKVYWPILF